MRHETGKPGLMGAAFAPRFRAVEYSYRLACMSGTDLFAEYEAQCARFYKGDVSDYSCERVRLCRREVLRRIGSAAA
jgi:hypothetical protein